MLLLLLAEKRGGGEGVRERGRVEQVQRELMGGREGEREGGGGGGTD